VQPARVERNTKKTQTAGRVDLGGGGAVPAATVSE